MSTNGLVALALASSALQAAGTAALHATIQGRWRADNRQIAEQVPGWGAMTAGQGQKVLAVIPPLEFEITADRIVLKPSGQDEPDEAVSYSVTGRDARTLQLRGKNEAGEQKSFRVEVLGPDELRIASPEAATLTLTRVPPASPPAP